MTDIVWADIDKDVIIVQGDDAQTFLHSQLANDIASLAVGASMHSLLLEPTGHILAIARVVRHEDTVFTLDVDAGFADAVIVRLQRFVLRAKVTMRRSDWVVRAFRGSDAVREIGIGPGRAVPYWGSSDELDVVGDASLMPKVGEQTEPERIDFARADARWPKLGVDVLVGDIPGTTGILSAAVSFTKGCYPGQELVERMDSRGTTAPVVVRALPRDGLGVGARVMENDQSVGTVTSIGAHIALARISRTSTVGEPLV
jgi:folate-binding protein YgfZ